MRYTNADMEIFLYFELITREVIRLKKATS